MAALSKFGQHFKSFISHMLKGSVLVPVIDLVVQLDCRMKSHISQINSNYITKSFSECFMHLSDTTGGVKKDTLLSNYFEVTTG